MKKKKLGNRYLKMEYKKYSTNPEDKEEKTGMKNIGNK